MNTANRSIWLDCIRTVAISLVLIYHVAKRLEDHDLDLIANWFLEYGTYGVDMFFPLSGFLITRYLLQPDRPGKVSIFFLRRFFRIIPIYYAAIISYLIGDYLVTQSSDAAEKSWMLFSFLAGWFIAINGESYVPYTISWSLSVEEFAYILLGLGALLLRSRLIYLVLFFAIAPVLLRLYLYLDSFEYTYFYYLPLARLDSIAYGGLLAFLMSKQIKNLLFSLIMIEIALISLAMSNDMLGRLFTYPAISVLTLIGIVLAESHYKYHYSKCMSAVSKVGFYSYFIYLFHFFNIDILILIWSKVAPVDEYSMWPIAIGAMFVTYIQAWVSFKWFEMPLMKFGRSFEPRLNGSSLSNASVSK